ncbi:hypothetical protein NXX60_26460 [Bacteroides thetaiotaomicron]|nr:hypothetical protein NXX60_26460 [Bacteroides thetaiotaomicron]
MAGWFQLAHDIRNSPYYNMFYIILVISIIVISLIIGHISSSNNKPIGFKDDNFTIARSSISPDQKQEKFSQRDEDKVVTIDNNSFSKWKEEYGSLIKEEEEQGCNYSETSS